jgi:hypothetical protein
MIRPKLPHPLGDRRHSRRHRRRGATGPTDVVRHPAPAVESAPPSPLEQHIARMPAPMLDLDVQRVQQAGGPIDHAYYGCACGYLFSADVSTTVTCPHCGAGQVW